MNQKEPIPNEVSLSFLDMIYVQCFENSLHNLFIEQEKYDLEHYWDEDAKERRRSSYMRTTPLFEDFDEEFEEGFPLHVDVNEVAYEPERLPDSIMRRCRKPTFEDYYSREVY